MLRVLRVSCGVCARNSQGDKETKRWFGGNSRYENASEKFDKAGLAFKLAKNCA